MVFPEQIKELVKDFRQWRRYVYKVRYSFLIGRVWSLCRTDG